VIPRGSQRGRNKCPSLGVGDPPFAKEWSTSKPTLPDIEAIAARWEGRLEEGEDDKGD
jgi:hypothetical protein